MLKLSNKTTQILSSGQVITSASNVVKELVENSLDAAADIIEVKLEKGGLGKIEVRDNGNGIKASEVGIAARRHYTSKMRFHSDLESLTTYGFRGEALSSICELADVVITTRTKDEAYSFVYTLNTEGCVRSKKPSHIAQGTTVTVTNLFRNLPVRKQFFSSAKKLREQLNGVEDILMAFAISNPAVQFKLINDRSMIWQKPKSKDERSAFLLVLPSTGMNLQSLSTKCETTNIDIKIFFPKSYLRRKSLDRFFLFINKRPVRHKKIEKIVRKHLLEMTNESDQIIGWPTVCLTIDIPTAFVDVNVNPNKTEVHLSCIEVVLSLLEKMFDVSSPKAASVEMNVVGQVVDALRTTNQDQKQVDKTLVVERDSHLSSENQLPNERKANYDVLQTKLLSENATNIDASIKTAQETEKLFEVTHSKNITDIGTAVDNLKGNAAGQDNMLLGNMGMIEKICHLPSENKDQLKTAEKVSCNFRKAAIASDYASDNNENLKDNVEIDVLFDDDDTLLNQAANAMDICEKENKLLDNKTINSDKIECSSSIVAPKNRSSKSTEVGTKNWSCGDAVIDNDGKVIEPVRVIRPLSCGNTALKRPISATLLKQSTLDNVTTSSEIKRPRTIFEVSRDTTDKDWSDLNQSEQAEVVNIACKEYNTFSKQTTLKLQNKTRKSFVKLPKQIELEEDCPKIPQILDFEKLSQKIVAMNSNCSNYVPQETIHIVGSLSERNAAVIKYGSDIFLVNLFRLREFLALRRLMQDYTLPCTQLKTAIEILENDIGTEAFSCLQNLFVSSADKSDERYEIYDERIVRNGFQIRKLISRPNFFLCGMTCSIPCYGLEDLKEILLKISYNKATSLCDCRPRKCIYYLQGEASRRLQTDPVLRDKAQLRRALNSIKQTDASWKETFSNSVCFHAKKIFSHLHAIKIDRDSS